MLSCLVVRCCIAWQAELLRVRILCYYGVCTRTLCADLRGEDVIQAAVRLSCTSSYRSQQPFEQF